ncbi:MAG: hypothetical protein ACXW1S_08940 [Acidimicrobiia bacterium]
MAGADVPELEPEVVRRLDAAVVAGLDRLPHGAPPIWGMQRRPARPVEA